MQPVTDWNPSQYLAFADERARPALDLLARVPVQRPRLVYDLGCGPGNSTKLLRDRFPQARMVGLDRSPAMISKARETVTGVEFNVGDAGMWHTDRAADLIFSNALFQWVPDHPHVLQRIVRDIKQGAVLAVQLPDNLGEPSHRMMREVAGDARWHGKLANAAKARMGLPSPTEYYDLLRPHTRRVEMWRTTYMHAVDGHAGIADFFGSTGLKPFLDPLTDPERIEFRRQYLDALSPHYPVAHDGKVLLALPRLFILVEK